MKQVTDHPPSAQAGSFKYSPPGPKSERASRAFPSPAPSDIGGSPYEEVLLERSRTQWQFGDWQSLVLLTRAKVEGHPERAKLALLVAAAHQQVGNLTEVRAWVELAQSWGCPKKLVGRVLIAGVYETLGRAALIVQNEEKAEKWLRHAVRTGMPGSEARLWCSVRRESAKRQISSALAKARQGLRLDAARILQHSSITTPFDPPAEDLVTNLPVSQVPIVDCKKLRGVLDALPVTASGRKVIQTLVESGKQSFGMTYRPDSRGDRGVLRQIFNEKQYAVDWIPQTKQLRDLYAEILGDGKKPLIVDAGANIGASVIWFISEFPNATVFAIEPDRENCELLLQNCAGLDVKLFHGGIWNARGNQYLDDPGEGDWGFRVNAIGKERVSVLGVEDVLALCADWAAVPLILKLDIEGSESVVFDGPCNWLEHIPMIIIELHDWMFPGEGRSANFLRAIGKYRFELFTRGENIFCYNRKFLT